MDHPIWKRPNLAYLFIHLLLRANFSETKVLLDNHTYTVARGQLITGRMKLSAETGINQNTLKDMLLTLQSLQLITISSTNKFSLITIIKYSEYQLTPKFTPAPSPTKHQQNTSQTPQDNINNKGNKNILDAKASRRQGLRLVNPHVHSIWHYAIDRGYNSTREQMNRYAIRRLLNKFKPEEIREMVDITIRIRGERMAPQVYNFLDLEQKLPNLKAFFESKATKPKGIFKL